GYAIGLLPTLLALLVGTDGAGWVLIAVANVLGSLLTMPVVAAATVLVYLDLRVRTEGLDLELEAAEVLPARCRAPPRPARRAPPARGGPGRRPRGDRRHPPRAPLPGADRAAPRPDPRLVLRAPRRPRRQHVRRARWHRPRLRDPRRRHRR